jgi:predicted enzyme related to lactoylglutathione lyase
MADEFAELKQTIHPVDDVSAAIEFYRQAFGFSPKFTDGDRYAALLAGETALALVSAEEDLVGQAAAGIKVTDLAAAVRSVVGAGGTVVGEPQRGPHEERAVVRDPWGNPLVLYTTL